MSARHLVVGTAGHIDHGKSALVRALTGTDPDRLAEEQRRGITIELGFADLVLDPERVVSIVDVPGHERFVRHMVAGASGIDAVLLVVASDQGVQPQTREHLAICSLLGIRHGLIVMTKADLVDPELRDVAALEVRDLAAGTFLEDAPLLTVAAPRGEGLEELRTSLGGLFAKAAERPSDGIARLGVDRSFVLRGFGSVVTGTLVSGRLVEGANVEIFPGGRRARVRGLQVHHAATTQVRAGQRAAINLQGVDTADVPRGSVIGEPGRLQSTRRAWARLRLLPGAPKGMAAGGEVRFHQGTCERAARYRVLGRDEDGTLHVELHLDEPTVLLPGDRFIVRRPAPVDTAGGGVILDARPPRARAARAVDFAADAASPEVALRLRLERAGPAGVEPVALASDLGWTPERTGEALEQARGAGLAVEVGSRWVAAKAHADLARAVLQSLDAFHRVEPLRPGMPREALRAAAGGGIEQESWRRLLEQLAAQGELRLADELVARSDHEVRLAGADRALAERLEALFREAGLEPPERERALAAAGGGQAAERLLDLLLARGALVKLHGGRLFHRDALERLRERLIEFARGNPRIDVAAFKELAGVSRKHAIPLLEHFDETRVTRRVGNEREILVS